MSEQEAQSSSSSPPKDLTLAQAEAAAAKAIAAMRIGLTKSSPPKDGNASTIHTSTSSSGTISHNPSMSSSYSSSRVAVLECDYDVNPTYLYQAVEARQWNVAMKYLTQNDDDDDDDDDANDENNNNESNKKSTTSSPQQEAATWVTRKEPNGKLRWRLLPIHAAVIFKAPIGFLEVLLSEYPQAAQCKDDQGMLPLHLAFRNAAEWDILEELLTAYPQGIHVKDRKGRIPIQCAASQTKKQISVIELYTQIVATSERSKAVQESNALLDAKMDALQVSHVQALQQTKEDYQGQIERMKAEYEEKIEILEQTKITKETIVQEYKSTLTQREEEIQQKTQTEQALAQKLEQATHTLSTLLEAQSEYQKQSRETMLVRYNTELLDMVEKLLTQQKELKTNLDQQSYDIQQKEDEFKQVLDHYQNQRKVVNESLNKDRIMWRGTLQDSNRQMTDKLTLLQEKLSTLTEEIKGEYEQFEQDYSMITAPSDISSVILGTTTPVGTPTRKKSTTPTTTMKDEKKEEQQDDDGDIVMAMKDEKKEENDEGVINVDVDVNSASENVELVQAEA